MHQKNQSQVIQADIKGAIRYAKTKALIDGKSLVLKPLQDSTDWSNGMQLFIDNATTDAELIHEWRWTALCIHVTWHGFQSRRDLLFSSEISQNAVNGYFEIKTHSNQIVNLVVNRLGRVRESTTVQ